MALCCRSSINMLHLYTMRGLGCPKALFVSQLDRSLEASTNDKRGNSFLLTRLRDETSTQISKFYKLLNTLRQSMMLRNISLEELASTLLMQLPAFTGGKASIDGQPAVSASS